MASTTHSPFGPSKLRRILNCFGSYHAEKDLEDNPSPSGVEGTQAHSLAEQALVEGIPVLDTKGNIPEKDKFGGEMEYPLEMRQYVQEYLDFIWDLLEDGDELYVEQEVSVLTNLPSPANKLYGTVDALIYNPKLKKLKLIDLKYGKGKLVTVEGNEQLMAYGAYAIAMDEFPVNKKALDAVTTYIYQPRIPNHRDHARPEVYSKKELDHFYKDQILMGIQAALDPEAPRTAGDWCDWCKAQGTCKEFGKTSLAVAQVEFDDNFDLATEADELVPVKTPNPDELTLEEIGFIIQQTQNLTRFLKVVGEHATKAMKQGTTIPGAKLVNKDTHRKWDDEEKAMDQINSNRRLPTTKLTTRRPLTPAKMEEALEELGISAPKLMKMVVKPEGDLVAVPVTDPRPAIVVASQADPRSGKELTSSADDDFSDFDEPSSDETDDLFDF